MKKIIALALTAMLVFTACSKSEPAPSEPAINDGTYTASAWGNNGEIEVEVTVAEGAIASVEVLSHKESKGISVEPIAQIPAKIVEYQTVGVDAMSGGTMTSNGIKNAVKACLEEAGASESFFAPATVDLGTVEDTECDVVVVGSGAAGMATAIHAVQEGAKVILVEKQDILGGTSLLANSMFGSVGTSVHKAEGKTETVEDLVENYLKPEAATGGCLAEEASARVLAEHSAEQAEYLISLGVPLDHTSSKFILAPQGGSGLGSYVIPALTGVLEDEGVDIRLSTRATHILTEDGKATGIEVETAAGTYKIKADAVVLTTGGFAAGRDMVKKYLPAWSNSLYYCSPADTGDGHIMAEEVGVELVDMTIMKANPLCFLDHTNTLTMNAAVGAGAIMVNHEGVRFANEQGGYGMSPRILEQTDGEGIVIFDNTLVEANDTIKGYLAAGYLTEADSLDEIADLMNIDKDALAKTVEDYKVMVENGKDEDFGRRAMADLLSGEKFYAIKVKPSIQGTFGGIPTNLETEVLLPDGSVFAGLYAAGECAQEGINGLNPMTANMVFGTIAGTNAAAYAAN